MRCSTTIALPEKSWYWVANPQITTCGDLRHRLREYLQLYCPIQLLLEGFTLPCDGMVADLVKPGEILDVIAEDCSTLDVGTHHVQLQAEEAQPFKKRKTLQPTQLSASQVEAWHSEPPPGLCYIPELLTPDEEADIVSWVDSEGAPWSKEITRRTQQYGPKFHYGGGGRYLQHNAEFPHIPAIFDSVIAKLRGVVDDGTSFPFPYEPDQIIINEYFPGQGIAPHIDRPDLFDDCVASVSLLSDVVMNFTHIRGRQAAHNRFLRRRSGLIFKGPARYEFRHGIQQKVQEEMYVDSDGEEQCNVRSRRLSITLRRVLPEARPAVPQDALADGES